MNLWLAVLVTWTLLVFATTRDPFAAAVAIVFAAVFDIVRRPEQSEKGERDDEQ